MIRKDGSTAAAWLTGFSGTATYDSNVVCLNQLKSVEAIDFGFCSCNIELTVNSIVNTEGSETFSFQSSDDYYILGLWLADGYWRSSSIGLSSISEELISRFSRFLSRFVPGVSLKYRTYEVGIGQKRKSKAVHVYVNNRSLTRWFMNFRKSKLIVPRRFLIAYLAGRIDGDGHVDQKHRSGVRIAYGTEFDALRDYKILEDYKEGSVSLYRYVQAGTWVIYLRKKFLQQIVPELSVYSMKFCPVETKSEDFS